MADSTDRSFEILTRLKQNVSEEGMLSAPATLIEMCAPIGSGKTFFSDYFGKRYRIKVYHESAPDEEKLQQYYLDMKRYAFSLQIHFLTQRSILQDSIPLNEPAIVDRTPYEDTVFAHMLRGMGLISPEDYDTYVKQAGVVYNKMRRPTVIVYLDVPPTISLQRIRSRGRKMEAGIDLQYLVNLYASYELFLKEISRTIPVIRVDWSVFPDHDGDAGLIVDAVTDEIMNILANMSMLYIVSIPKLRNRITFKGEHLVLKDERLVLKDECLALKDERLALKDDDITTAKDETLGKEADNQEE